MDRAKEVEALQRFCEEAATCESSKKVYLPAELMVEIKGHPPVSADPAVRAGSKKQQAKLEAAQKEAEARWDAYAAEVAAKIKPAVCDPPTCACELDEDSLIISPRGFDYKHATTGRGIHAKQFIVAVGVWGWVEWIGECVYPHGGHYRGPAPAVPPGLREPSDPPPPPIEGGPTTPSSDTASSTESMLRVLAVASMHAQELTPASLETTPTSCCGSSTRNLNSQVTVGQRPSGVNRYAVGIRPPESWIPAAPHRASSPSVGLTPSVADRETPWGREVWPEDDRTS